MNKKQLTNAYAEWLDDFDWDWFGTLTFRGYPRKRKAELLFNTWIGELAQSRASSRLRWVRVSELGAYRVNLHYHVLVGGLKANTDSTDWAERWAELAGGADIRDFDQRQGGIRYLLKTLLPDHEFDIELNLPQARSVK